MLKLAPISCIRAIWIYYRLNIIRCCPYIPTQ